MLIPPEIECIILNFGVMDTYVVVASFPKQSNNYNTYSCFSAIIVRLFIRKTVFQR